jgi:hypothetical protein
LTIGMVVLPHSQTIVCVSAERLTTNRSTAPFTILFH